MKYGVPHDSKIGPLFFLLYINYQYKIISDKSNPVSFASDMSIMITNVNPLAFRNTINEV